MQDIVQGDYGSWPDGLPKKGGANALSGAGSLDPATTYLSKTSRTKNFIIELLLAVLGRRNPSGSAGDACLDAAAHARWAERAVDGGVVAVGSVPQLL